MIPTISATALGRRYRDQVALDDISLTVEPGTVSGLLAALAAVLGLGGFASIRRVTV
jgi:ABC-type Na+ transport system ATPase subunit NatA